MPVYIAVVGPGASATEAENEAARAVGAALAEAGAVVLTGGHGGVMAAAAEGCADAGGVSIALLPERDRAAANPYSTFTIPTGLGELRNGLLVRAADAVICIALSWGTLSEVALAVRTGVPVVALGDWTLPLAGPMPAATPTEAVHRALAAAVRP
ncbi:MAG TPA: dethiobiotin synthetase [Candidatus Nanopelagicales bacterium]